MLQLECGRDYKRFVIRMISLIISLAWYASAQNTQDYSHSLLSEQAFSLGPFGPPCRDRNLESPSHRPNLSVPSLENIHHSKVPDRNTPFPVVAPGDLAIRERHFRYGDCLVRLDRHERIAEIEPARGRWRARGRGTWGCICTSASCNTTLVRARYSPLEALLASDSSLTKLAPKLPNALPFARPRFLPVALAVGSSSSPSSKR